MLLYQIVLLFYVCFLETLISTVHCVRIHVHTTVFLFEFLDSPLNRYYTADERVLKM